LNESQHADAKYTDIMKLNKSTDRSDSRDSSTMRLRQMIAFKQFKNKNHVPNNEKMMDKLKPYFNKFRIKSSNHPSSKLNKVIYSPLVVDCDIRQPKCSPEKSKWYQWV